MKHRELDVPLHAALDDVAPAVLRHGPVAEEIKKMKAQDRARFAKPRRLLIADRSPLVAHDLGTIVEDLGLTVGAVVRSEGEALRILATQPIDAAIFDYVLEDGRALTLVDWLERERVPALMITGLHAGELPAESMTRRLLAKPFSRQLVVHALRALSVIE